MYRSNRATRPFAVVSGILIVLATVIDTTAAYAATSTFYVSPTGVDAGTCSSTAPCATFGYATSLAQPGSTVLVQSGTYPQQIIQNVAGTAGAPITVMANGSVTLTRPSPASATSQQTPLLQIVNTSYLAVQGFSVVGMKGRKDWNKNVYPDDTGAVQPSGTGAEVEFSNHIAGTGVGIVVQNLSISHIPNNCLKAGQITALNNTITDCGVTGSSNLQHGIYVTKPGSILTGNLISQVSGDAISINSPSSYGDLVSGNVISYCGYAGILDNNQTNTTDPASVTRITGNTVTNCTTGLTLSTGYLVDHNIIAKNQSRGILFLWGNPSWASVGPITLDHNDFYANGYELLNSAAPQPGDSLVVQNSIFHAGGRSPESAFTGQAPPTMVAVADDIYGMPSLAPGLLTCNPLFVNPTGNFHISSKSPILAKATDGTQIGALGTT